MMKINFWWSLISYLLLLESLLLVSAAVIETAAVVEEEVVVIEQREPIWKGKLHLRNKEKEAEAEEKLKQSSSSSSSYRNRKEEEPETRIVEGKATDTDKYEWMVAFSGKSDSYRLDLFCGGSLIRNTNPPIALTAAHCIEGLSDELYEETGEDFTFYATLSRNNVDTQTSGESADSYITVRWKDYVYHENYNADDNNRNDIALVLLEYNAKVSSQNTVKLQTATKECCNDGDIVTVLGYGATETDEDISGFLEYANLSYVSQDTCNKWYYLWTTLPSGVRQVYDYASVDWSTVEASEDYIYPGMICAYSDERDSCQGDSGGPLINSTAANSAQIGIVSWGVGCADELPGVYTSVGYYKKWIQANMDCLLNESYVGQCSGATQVAFWFALCVAFGTLFWSV